VHYTSINILLWTKSKVISEKKFNATEYNFESYISNKVKLFGYMLLKIFLVEIPAFKKAKYV